MDTGKSKARKSGEGWIKTAAIFFVMLLLITLLSQSYLSTSLAQSNTSGFVNPVAQVINTDTPTPTSTATITPTPTLMPLTFSFQDGVFPSASYNGMVDTYISQEHQFGNYGLASALQVNGVTTTGAANANHALLKWDISLIPPGSEILSASLTFNVITPTVDTYPIYQLLKPWVYNEASWENYAGGLPWQVPGALGPEDRGAQVLTSFAPISAGQYVISLNRAVVQSWIDTPALNYGLIIADSTGTVPVIFDSAESTTPSYRPKLTIQFKYPPGTTPTATFTATPTETQTATTTQTVTPTFTSTPTVSGTPPTPTVTGTIVPTMEVEKAVSPSQATVGQLFNFTIQITNSGLAPALDASLTDTLPSVLTMTGAQTTKGTYSINSTFNTITFVIGRINPSEVVKVSFLAQVNTTAVANTNYTNSATLSYKDVTVNQSKTSNSVSYRILGSSTLPGTGLSEINSGSGPSGIVIATLAITALLGILGLAVVVFGQKAKTKQSSWASWLTRTGVILIVSACVFGLVTWALNLPAPGSNLFSAPVSSSTPERVALNQKSEAGAYQFIIPTATPEKLPDFPIPSPTVQVTPGEEKPDISPVEHILIPAIGLDTIVKFVPYDGFTWAIAGLKQEVAWMGDTSWPGLGKNTGLAGHVTLVDGSNGPFRYLADLRAGDIISVSTQENIYTYKVREQAVVEDSNFNVLQPTDKPQLTLITCTNWNKDLKLYLNRLIVYADLAKVEPIKSNSQSN
jgi:LPXTG-site transpeptidase (sortase) family protein